MSVDVIGNFLTIIRNGVKASKSFVVIPYSSIKYEIAKILLEEGFVRDVEVIQSDENQLKKFLQITLKYLNRESVIHEIKRSSKPGLRYYAGADDLRRVTSGLGLAVITTNQGIMSHKKAKKLNVGGEIICTVW
jgi:small subunit ribosomal protein S8